MQIVIPLYDRFTALDAVGPYEVLSRLPGASVTWLAHEPGVIRTDGTMLGIEADAAFEDLPDPEIVLVPGGTGTDAFLDDERLVGWIRRAHETSEWTTSVCTGSLLLGAAGVLDGLEATCHWLDIDDLERYGARPTSRSSSSTSFVPVPPGTRTISGSGRSSNAACASIPSMPLSLRTTPGSCASQVTLAPGSRESTS